MFCVAFVGTKNGKDVGRIANQFRVVKDQTLHQRTAQIGSVPAWMPCFDCCDNQLHFIVHGLNHVSTERKEEKKQEKRKEKPHTKRV
jgi:hypothetical protein